MLLGIIFYLLVLGVLCLAFKCKKVGFSILTITLSLFLFVGSGMFVSCIDLQKFPTTPVNLQSHHWKKNNTIIVLGAGIAKIPETTEIVPTPLGYGNIYGSAHLYFSCKKAAPSCNIIATGGDPKKLGSSEGAVYKDALVNLGVDPNDIIVEDKSLNTFQNAEFSSKLINTRKNQSLDHEVFLVTSAFHIPRSLLYFNHFDVFPTPIPVGYFDSTFSLIPTSYHLIVAHFTFNELIGFARYTIYNLFNLNVSTK